MFDYDERDEEAMTMAQHEVAMALEKRAAPQGGEKHGQ
jgi:hypothetical protein